MCIVLMEMAIKLMHTIDIGYFFCVRLFDYVSRKNFPITETNFARVAHYLFFVDIYNTCVKLQKFL